MLISFGKGGDSGKDAATYLTQEMDHKNKPRAGVLVLKGDPFAVAKIADDLDFKRKYSAGIIAWSLEENPSNEEINHVLSEFEKLTFSGMDKDQYSWSAVQHISDDGSKHIHFLIARVDLESGKSFNPAPPGHRKDFDALRDKFNHEKGWARPDDPSRGQLSQDGHLVFLDPKDNPKKSITDFLAKQVELGLVVNRAGVRAALARMGEITREGDNYISVKPKGFNRALRLKGLIYERDFTPESILKKAAEVGSRTERGGIVSEKKAKEADVQLQEAIARRSLYNNERYPKADKNKQEQTPFVRSDDLAGHLSRQLGGNAIGLKPEQPLNGKETKNDGIRNSVERAIRKIEQALRRKYEQENAIYRKISEGISNLEKQSLGHAKTARRINEQQQWARESDARTKPVTSPQKTRDRER